ncbi:hypothetical protein ACU610_00630 [Geodermatophilus sp. URMC 61]|uniref:hypothetical protein n=1 Tax=Geodermatophilus sp. URMC 61 TaxID=3423411 RepID=UPI00406C1540
MSLEANLLEVRYRRLLRLLPEPARSRWTDDMVATYLTASTANDPEYAEFGSPTLADRVDVWRLALRLRLGAPGATVRAVVAGQTLRLVALIGSAALAAQALLGLAVTAWWYGLLPGVPAPALTAPFSFGPGDALVRALDVLIVALAVCLFGGVQVARPLAVGILLGEVLVTLVQASGPSIVSAALWLATMAVPLLAAGLVPAQPVPRRLRWLVGLAALGTVLLPGTAVAWWAASGQPDQPSAWLVALTQPTGPWAVAVVAAGVVVLTRRSATPAARLGVAALGLAVLPALANQLAFGEPACFQAVVATELVLTGATVFVTGLAGGRAVQALPAGVTGDGNG